MTRYFVYIPGSRGPEAQIWDHDAMEAGDGKKKVATIGLPIKLNAMEQDLSIESLKVLYPVKVDDAKPSN